VKYKLIRETKDVAEFRRKIFFPDREGNTGKF
jgi:hypothetical protein